MRFRHFLYGVLVAVLFTVPVGAQGSLSNQVLRLLTRNNTWSGTNTFNGNVTINGSCTGCTGSGAPSSATYILQTANGTLTNAQVLSVLSTGIMKVTTGTGVVSSVAAPAGAIVGTTDAQALSNKTGNISQWTNDSGYATASSATAFTNKTGNISQWTNDSAYITNAVTTLAFLTSVGTIATGTWNATIISPTKGGTGVNNGASTITLGGNLTTSGAFATTLTVTGGTNVTLPTSGTLITNSVATLSSLTSVGTIGTGVWQGTAIGPTFGGTGFTTATAGDIIYASAANTWAKLAKSVASKRYLSNQGAANIPDWQQVDLASGVTGILPAANGGLGSGSAPSNGQIPIGNGTGFAFQTIAGTANQVTVTNGAGTITLSTPQSIGIGSTPQFARLGLGTGAGATAVLTTTGQINVGIFDNGSQAAAVTFNWNSGMVQKVTLTGGPVAITLSNPISGVAEYVVYLTQDGTGSRTVTWPGSVSWKGGSAPTLTTTATKTDIIYLKWNGTVYYGSSDLNF